MTYLPFGFVMTRGALRVSFFGLSCLNNYCDDSQPVEVPQGGRSPMGMTITSKFKTEGFHRKSVCFRSLGSGGVGGRRCDLLLRFDTLYLYIFKLRDCTPVSSDSA